MRRYLAPDRALWLCAVSTLLAVAAPARAQVESGPGGHERASVSFAAFITDRESTVRLDSANRGGTDINMEDDLGFDPSLTVARIDGHYWFNKRHRFDGTYFDLNRSAEHRIDETINFGDNTYTINTLISGEQKFSIFKLDYTYAFLAPERGFLGLTGGLYVSKSTYTLTAGAANTESEDLTAPLPVLGLRGDYAVTDRITLGGAWEWFGFESDNVDGHLTDFYVGADYRITKRFAAGLAYNRVSTSLGARDSGGFEGRLAWKYDGMLLYAKLDF
ncbi:MAG TPA: hypothetical protein VFX89_09375 [Gammaproteobacteria bacterium]|nr:hypothetical protein [Gammaproteobacteria bacterium]